jgi:hypothetical protein
MRLRQRCTTWWGHGILAGDYRPSWRHNPSYQRVAFTYLLPDRNGHDKRRAVVAHRHGRLSAPSAINESLPASAYLHPLLNLIYNNNNNNNNNNNSNNNNNNYTFPVRRLGVPHLSEAQITISGLGLTGVVSRFSGCLITTPLKDNQRFP